ncbi:MAG: glycosyltransferase [Vicinamibacterales bacterium]
MTSFDTGGTERQMIELVRRLSPDRWTVHVACLRAEGPWRDRVTASAASVTEFPVRSFRRAASWRQALAFARWCRRLGITVVHASDLYTNIFALPAARLAGVRRRLGNRRGLNRDRSPAQRALQTAAYSCAHAVVANSEAAATRLREEGVPAGKVAVVPNGIDCDRFRPRLHAGREPLRRVVTVANLRPEKGHDVLVDAAAAVLARHPDASFDLVGAGPERERIAARAAERGLGDRVRFLGPRDDIPEVLAAADIFVLPSRTESLPNAVLEAMAAGLPVVASAVGGLVDVIDDGRSGLLVPADNPPVLADRLVRLMDDASLGARLGEAARREVRDRYSFDRMVDAFDRLYGQAA